MGLARLAAGVLGTSTLVNGLPCTPGTGLNVVLGTGEIYSLQATDSTAYGLVGTDAHSILKQGLLSDPATLACPAPGSAGQSIVYLIEAQLQEVDGGSQNIPFFNSANPTVPSYADTNTVRSDVCALRAKAGAPAATGSQVPPTVDAGWVPLYTITVAFGATFLTSANIVVAQGAPFLLYNLVSLKAYIDASVSGVTPETPNGFGALTNIASASSTDLGTVLTRNALITGTTGITGFGASASTASPIYLTRFQGAVTLTASSRLLLAGAANLTTAANDEALWSYEGSTGGGTWRLLAYFPAAGTDPAGSAAAALVSANANAAAGDAGKMNRDGGNSTLPAVTPFTYGAAPARQVDVLTGGEYRVFNGWSTAQSFTAAAVVGGLNLLFVTAATTFGMPPCNAVRGGAPTDFAACTALPVTLTPQGSDQFYVDGVAVASYVIPPFGKVRLASDGGAYWHVVMEFSSVFRQPITAPAALLTGALDAGLNDQHAVSAAFVKRMGRRYGAQDTLNASRALTYLDCGKPLIIYDNVSATLPSAGLTAGDEVSLVGAGAGATVAPGAGWNLYLYGVGAVSSLSIPAGWWFEAYYDGTTYWIVREYGPSAGGSRLTQLYSQALSGAAADFTWSAASYERLLVSVIGAQISGSSSSLLMQLRRADGTWGGAYALSSAGGGPFYGSALITGGQLNNGVVIGSLAGTSYADPGFSSSVSAEATMTFHTGGLAGVRITTGNPGSVTMTGGSVQIEAG